MTDHLDGLIEDAAAEGRVEAAAGLNALAERYQQGKMTGEDYAFLRASMGGLLDDVEVTGRRLTTDEQVLCVQLYALRIGQALGDIAANEPLVRELEQIASVLYRGLRWASTEADIGFLRSHPARGGVARMQQTTLERCPCGSSKPIGQHQCWP